MSVEKIETWGDIPKGTNKALIKELKKQINDVLSKAKISHLVISLVFEDLIKEIGKRLTLEGPIIDPDIDLWEKDTIIVTCPFCHKGYYLVLKKLQKKWFGRFTEEIGKYLNDDIPETEPFLNKDFEYWQGIKEEYDRLLERLK